MLFHSNSSAYVKKMSSGALRWKFLQSIQEVATKSSGYVFGGFPRDALLHEHFAKEYYKAEKEAVELWNFEDPFESWNYEDPTTHPASYPGRINLPTDIDVMMDTESLEGFLTALDFAQFSVLKTSTTPVALTRYKCADMGVADPSLLLTSIRVSVKGHPLLLQYMGANLPSVKVDIVHKEGFLINTDFKFELVDFACNSLYISPEGILGSATMEGLPGRGFMTNMTRIQRITQDCIDMKAVPVRPTDARMTKMIQKGFRVVSAVTTIFCDKDSKCEEDDMCLLCHDTMRGKHCVKMNCCVAQYHFKCFAEGQTNIATQYNNHDNCMMCRRDLYTEGSNQVQVNKYLRLFAPKKK
jgi:hypothetical protein